MATEEGKDVKRRVATKALRAKQRSAKHTVEERDANTWGAQSALKAKLIIVSLMEVGDAAASLRDALKPHVANPGYASNTVAVRGVELKDAREVPRDKLVFVSRTVVGGGVRRQSVLKVLKGVQTTAKLMAEGSVVYSLDALKELRGVLLCVRRTVEGNVVCLMEVGYVLRACMVGRASV